MGWQDALDVQIDIYNFLASDVGERFARRWMAATAVRTSTARA